MSHQEIIQQLRGIVWRLHWLNILQLVPDTLVIYGILQLAFSSQVVMLFSVAFSRQQAVVVTVMFALMDLCVTGIRANDRLVGKRLIAQVKGHLTAAEAELIHRFERFK